MKTCKLNIGGKVQGVCFRQYTLFEAQKLNLKGTVQNLSDGSVEIFAQGTDEQIEKLKQWAWKGSPFSRVETVNSSMIEIKSAFYDFQII